jgi:ATP-binding cassette subfamily F protein 1
MKKLADKERRQIEEAHRAKAAALRDDDNVFDVAYEQQGGEGQDVLSATDIKVCEDTHTFIQIKTVNFHLS